MTGKEFADKTEGWTPGEIFLSFCVGELTATDTPGAPSKRGTATDAMPEKEASTLLDS